MMNIVTIPVGQLGANAYLCEIDGICICVDPGDDAGLLLEHISRNKWHLHSVLLTHGHFDHCMAVGELQLHIPGLVCYVHPKDQFLLERVKETASHFLGYPVVILQPGNMRDVRNFSNPLFQLQVIETPGHTPGGVSLYFPDEALVFTGDVLFQNATGRTDFSYGSREEMQESLRNLFALPPQTRVYPGHGDPTSIKTEKSRWSHDT